MTDDCARVMIVDDHELIRTALRALLTNSVGMNVVGEARNDSGFLETVAELDPNVIVCELQTTGIVPDLTLLEAVRRRHAAIRIVVLSMNDSAEVIRASIQAGADAYVLKSEPPHCVMAAIEHAMRGEPYISPQSALRLTGKINVEARPEILLTRRHVQILTLIARGMSSRQIGIQLGSSHKTVDVQRTALMARMGLHDVASLTLYAVRMGLVNPQDGALATPKAAENCCPIRAKRVADNGAMRSSFNTATRK